MNDIGAWFKGLRGKLLLMVILPAVALVAVSFFAYKQIGDLSEGVEYANNNRGPRSHHAAEMETRLQMTFRAAWFTYINYENADLKNEGMDMLRKSATSFEASLAEYKKYPRPEKLNEYFKVIEEGNRNYQDLVTEFLGYMGRNNEKDRELIKSMGLAKLRPIILPMLKAFESMKQIRLTDAKIAADEATRSSSAMKTLLLVTTSLSTLALFVMGLLIASRLAQSLNGVTQRISEAGTQVSSASEQLSAASQHLSSGATEAASSLEETVSSLEELSSMVKLNADNAKEASSLSQSSRKSAEDGESEIKSLIGAMTDISKGSKKIEEIINVIDDIAFQTNLLALNAAVEAARAGEQGKGFAVVAEAVRNLAQRSASAAKDITVLIQESVEKIAHGRQIADQSGEVLKNIVTSVKKVADLNNEIASASAEQSNGISQISKAMNELDQTTQRNASSAEETAASSEEMSAQSLELQGMVRELSAVVQGAEDFRSDYQPRVEKPRGYGNFQGNSHGNSRAPVKKLSVVRGGAPSLKAANKVIPFDDDQTSGKVGTTDGF